MTRENIKKNLKQMMEVLDEIPQDIEIIGVSVNTYSDPAYPFAFVQLLNCWDTIRAEADAWGEDLHEDDWYSDRYASRYFDAGCVQVFTLKEVRHER